MATIASSISESVPILSGGRWTEIKGSRSGDVFNPSTGEVIGRVPFCTAEQTGGVVEAAAAALLEWSQTPVVERARLMFRLIELLVYIFV
jgi:malonate-semialdehyde dehydrogenase (acetylating)/methylmalonate-semialdehyde dehydrogenase